MNLGAKLKPFGEKGFIICFIEFCFRLTGLRRLRLKRLQSGNRITPTIGHYSPLSDDISAYSEGDTPKCLRKMVEKWARFEKPTV